MGDLQAIAEILRSTEFCCVGCGKGIKGADIKGSMKHPFCAACFADIWDNDYDKYFASLALSHS